MAGHTPQPETHVQAVTTPLVCIIITIIIIITLEIFLITTMFRFATSSSPDSKMLTQMKTHSNQAKAKGGKVCTCAACQSINCSRWVKCFDQIIPIITIITIIINCGRCTKCYDMISFGRDKEDTSVTCLQVRISAGA